LKFLDSSSSEVDLVNALGAHLFKKFPDAVEFERCVGRLDAKKETVTAEMGVIWYDVYKFMQATGTGLIPVGGGCPTVAPPGFMLGGGYSFVSRSYGMSIDNLLSLKIITPDGELRHIGLHSKAKEDIDLFWACRGGGGGNFGIVTEMEMNVRKPFSEKMLVGQIRFPLEKAEEVLDYYNDWVEKIPDTMAVYGFMGNQKDLVDKTTNVKVLGLTPVFNGECAEGIDLLQGQRRQHHEAAIALAHDRDGGGVDAGLRAEPETRPA